MQAAMVRARANRALSYRASAPFDAPLTSLGVQPTNNCVGNAVHAAELPGGVHTRVSNSLVRDFALFPTLAEGAITIVGNAEHATDTSFNILCIDVSRRTCVLVHHFGMLGIDVKLV